MGLVVVMVEVELVEADSEDVRRVMRHEGSDDAMVGEGMDLC